MGGSPLDPEEWDSVLGKLLRYHLNISEEIKVMIAKIKQEMKQEMVPEAEDRATYGKIVKRAIRSMWGLEYEILDIQDAFAKQMGSIDIQNLTDDFVEEMLLQSKPIQGVLYAIRCKQKTKLEEIKKDYWDHIKDLEPLKVTRPPKPEPKKEEPKKEGDAPKEGSDKKEEAPAAPPAEPAAPAAEAPAEAPAPAEAAPAEPAPAIDATQEPPAVQASA